MKIYQVKSSKSKIRWRIFLLSTFLFGEAKCRSADVNNGGKCVKKILFHSLHTFYGNEFVFI